MSYCFYCYEDGDEDYRCFQCQLFQDEIMELLWGVGDASDVE